jgi:hypothetical protein
MDYSSLGCKLLPVQVQPLIELGQPLGIDKGLEDTPNFVHLLLTMQGAKKS